VVVEAFSLQTILDAIDAREKRIAAELADADTKKAEAEKEHTDFEDKNRVFDQQRSALLGKAQTKRKPNASDSSIKPKKMQKACG